MKPSPLNNQTKASRLFDRTQYEVYLLEAIYSILENELFPAWPDAVIYPASRMSIRLLKPAQAGMKWRAPC